MTYMISLSSLADVLKSPKKQEEHDAYLLFYAKYSNPYGHGQKMGTILHAGRGDILRKSTVTSLCKRGIGMLELNPLTAAVMGNEWFIADRKEIFTNPEIYTKICRRCLAQIE